MPGGRPCEYTEETAEKLCEKLAQGISLRTACKADDMPDCSTVFSWMRKFPEFHKRYEEAKQESSDAMSEDIMEIADDETKDVQRARLQVDTRKWLMAKMKPKKYGEKVDMTTNGKDMPTPILMLAHVQTDNSDEKDHGDVQEIASGTGGNVGIEDGVNSPLLDSFGTVGQEANVN